MRWRVDEGGAGWVVDQGLGEHFFNCCELFFAGASGEGGGVVGGEFLGDLEELIGGFAGAEDDFGVAAAQGAVVIEGGEGKLLEGEGAEAGEGVLDV